MSSLVLCSNSESFLDQTVVCDENWILYDNQWWPAQWLDREEAPKHFPKLNLEQKNDHNHSLVICCPSDPLQLSKSQRNYYIWEVCSANQWDALKTAMPAVNIGQQKGSSSLWQHLNACHTSNTSKVERIGLGSFASSAILTWPLTNQLPLLQVSWKLAAGKTLPQPSGGIKCFPRVLWIQKHGFLCYRNKQAYFSLAKKCWL